jgi:hypothetical protein
MYPGQKSQAQNRSSICIFTEQNTSHNPTDGVDQDSEIGRGPFFRFKTEIDAVFYSLAGDEQNRPAKKRKFWKHYWN